MQGILPDEDPDTAGIPEWKRALMNKKMNKLEDEIAREQKMKEEEEEAYRVCNVHRDNYAHLLFSLYRTCQLGKETL